uniref:Uncharacterized protein n=1 Tax=Romanomermis culicivorax TaxID=13658 RepID=A0A915KLX9_ROMCU
MASEKSKLDNLKSMKGSRIWPIKTPKCQNLSFVQRKSSAGALQPAPLSSAGAIQNQLDYLRLEHDRAMREERRQNCYLCAIIVISLSMAAALIPVAFVNKFSDLIGWNYTEHAENLIAEFFYTDNADVFSIVSTTAAEAQIFNFKDQLIQEETFTTTASATIKSCMKLQPAGCFYHKNIYPNNCRKSTCHSIIVDLDILPHHEGWNLWVWNYWNETRSIDVEDWTPCVPGRLCIGGHCVDHPDALQHAVPQQQPGGVRVECDKEKSCVRFQEKLIQGKKALKLTTCENRSCVKKDQIFRETTTTSVSATTIKKANFTKSVVNLTESCMKLRPEGCFYHKNVYPDNCRKTTCHSIIINLDIL